MPALRFEETRHRIYRDQLTARQRGTPRILGERGRNLLHSACKVADEPQDELAGSGTDHNMLDRGAMMRSQPLAKPRVMWIRIAADVGPPYGIENGTARRETVRVAREVMDRLRARIRATVDR